MFPAHPPYFQAGKQFEYLTGGHVLAGFHEVVVSGDTVAAIERAKAASKPLWRISSTCFAHVASDNVLAPMEPFASRLSPEDAAKFPALPAGEQVRRELELIKLGAVTATLTPTEVAAAAKSE